MPLPSLPNDIIHAVLAEVDPSDLCNCAVVHSTWLHSVRNHLYKQIVVDLEEEENPLIVETLACEAHLRPFVRSLDFDGSRMSEDGTRPNADVLDMAQERELAEVWDEDMRPAPPAHSKAAEPQSDRRDAQHCHFDLPAG